MSKSSEGSGHAEGSQHSGKKSSGHTDHSDQGDEDSLNFQYLKWNSAEVKEFQAIWLSLVGTTDDELKEMAITLLLWMFEHVPNMKTHFQKFAKLTNDEIVSDQRFLMHAQGVIVMLNKLINALHTPENFDKMIINLVRKHLKLAPPVGLNYFKDFRDSIHLFVYEMTGAGKKSRPSVLFYQFMDCFVEIITEENKNQETVTKDSSDRKASVGDKAVKSGGGCCAIA